ncbi:MAG: hypothetical protein ACI9RM_001720 [Ulvibacter sp.]|jgi:hypothetical protein
MVSSAASLENVIDLENGGTQTLASNEVSTLVLVCDSIETNNIDLKEESLTSIIVFPNPSDGTIEIKNINESVEYKLYSITGKLYDTGVYSGGKLQLEFEGINLLELSKSGKSKTYKVIKMNSSR